MLLATRVCDSMHVAISRPFINRRHPSNHKTMPASRMSCLDVLHYYNIPQSAVGYAVGMAGQALIFSLIDHILYPLLALVLRSSLFRRKGTDSPPRFDTLQVGRSVVSFGAVIAVVLLLSKTILYPLVRVGDIRA